MLELIGGAQRILADIELEYQLEAAALKERFYARLTVNQEALERLDTELVKLMREHRDELFPEGTDQVTLKHGVLLHGHGYKVTIPRDAIARCEEEGYDDAVKIVKSIDRAVIEKWADAKLTVIGAKRKPIEKFEYEVKQ